ncbi:MAG: winged helix-turn-helix domain-containing protein [Roseiarcus sp.]|uniref:ATP-binding protein n=1 Tax=Roseiarcus sp. TaxID=1969460 RepID=UPI003C4FAFF3
MRPVAQARDVVSFGSFSLVVSERLLTRDGEPVELGARTLDTLIALLSRPNEVVSKKDLLAWVWPDVTVEEGSLRFHIAGLRKALGDGTDGARYIATVAGRGYCFVAPISRSGPDNQNTAAAPSFPYSNLPSRLMRMVGRDNDLLRLSTQLSASRFVTIVGAGGVGKTTVAVAVGHHLIEAFAGAVLFVDLGMLGDPELAATAVASMLGLSVQSNDAAPALIAYLRDKRLLLMLDTCEHLIEAVAALASQIFTAAPQVHILATSREALQVEGEHVYRLDSLACPPDDPTLTAAVAQTFPAPQLFMERAAASGARLDYSDAEAAIVVSICRKLDGVALAIELAARRVDAYGLQQTAALLDQRLTLLWLGPRTAPPRQRTLHAMLDWSYGLLSEPERVVLRRLAVFVGHFTLDAALAVVSSATIDQPLVFGAIDSLVAKSMVATRPLGAMMRYLLLDTTRAYALEISLDEAEFADLAVRHATYYRRWLEQSGIEWPTLSTGAQRAPHFAGLNNVRSALEWCFGANGNAEVGVGLAVAAAPVFLAMSLLPECHRWSERALGALDAAARGGLDEMRLQADLGVSLMFMRGGRDAAHLALNRSFAIAEQRGDGLDQLRLLGPLNMFHLRIGEFKTALYYARRCSDIAATVEDPAAKTLAHSILGISLHLNGDLSGARAELEAAVLRGPDVQRTTTIYLGFEGRILAGAILARTLWLQGHPVQAAERARLTVKYAAEMDHSLTLCIALIWAITVFLWIGDIEAAEEHIDWLVSRSESHSMAPYVAAGRAFKADLAIRRGDAKGGVEGLEGALEKLHAMPYELLTTSLNASLAQGLGAAGRFAEGLALIDETIALVDTNGDVKYTPELLRVKGALLLSMPEPKTGEAETCFMQSLDLSRRQGARGWELRTAIDLAALLAAQRRRERARAILSPVFAQFVEGSDTSDLKAAKRLLAALG